MFNDFGLSLLFVARSVFSVFGVEWKFESLTSVSFHTLFWTNL